MADKHRFRIDFARSAALPAVPLAALLSVRAIAGRLAGIADCPLYREIKEVCNLNDFSYSSLFGYTPLLPQYLCAEIYLYDYYLLLPIVSSPLPAHSEELNLTPIYRSYL